MKKLLTLALLAAVGVVSAASIDWKIGLAANKFYDKDGNTLAPVNAYLILAADYANWSDGLTSDSPVSDIAAALSAASLDGA